MKDEKLRMPFEVKKIRRRPGQSAGEHWRAIVDILVVAGWFCKCASRRDAQFLLLNEKQVATWVKNDTPQHAPDPKDLDLLRVKLEQYEP